MLTTSTTFDLRRPTARPSTRKPTFVAGSIDPDLTRESKTVAPGNMLLTLSFVALFAVAGANTVYNFCLAHNDAIVSAILASIPVVLLLAAAVLGRIIVVARRNGRPQTAEVSIATQVTDPALQVLPRRRTLPQVQRRGVSLSSFQTA